MLSINMDDVMAVVNNIKGYLIAFAVVLVIAIIVMIIAGKMKTPEKKLVRGEAGIAIILALIIVLNLVCR
ncbi:MAG: hypothetical protein IKS06_10640, partial [Lachnospiraceae bacterium]|nr:hypothetical protein [Lachnospiraceae bacterium]